MERRDVRGVTLWDHTTHSVNNTESPPLCFSVLRYASLFFLSFTHMCQSDIRRLSADLQLRRAGG